MGCLTGNIAYLGRLAATAERRGSLQARCGIICEVNGAAYLRVEPEVIWLMPSNFNYGEVDVYANVEWIAR